MESKLKVELISHTPNPEKLVASSAKLCYSKAGVDDIMEGLSDEKINKFIKILMDMGHESPLEHISFTFAIEGVSRALTHQLVRHRLASYSQQSQRYVDGFDFDYIIPRDIKDNKMATDIYLKHIENTQDVYNNLYTFLIADYCAEYYKNKQQEHFNNMIQTLEKENKPMFLKLQKRAYENARYVLPNCAETKIITTMNARSLLNFFTHRECERAQEEIRALATEMLRQVKEVCPIIFDTAGAKCRREKCGEGKMSCGNPKGGK